MTRWATGLPPKTVHGEYPRPQMVRKDRRHLNRLWDCAISADNAAMAGKKGTLRRAVSAIDGTVRCMGEAD